MTISMLQTLPQEKETELQLRREHLPYLPLEAEYLVREGWEGLDQAVDILAEKTTFGFAALLQAPIALLEAVQKS